MRTIKRHSLTISLLFCAVLMSTFVTQAMPSAKRFISFYGDCRWALQNPGDETKKQSPSAASVIEEEEDKIVEDVSPHEEVTEGSCTLVINCSPYRLSFDEPFIKVNALPPWA